MVLVLLMEWSLTASLNVKGFSKFGSYTGNGSSLMEHLFIQDLNQLFG
jgi:hypothetical protein